MYKALMSFAAMCVIAFVGYFFWGEFQKYERQKSEEATAKEIALMFAEQASSDKKKSEADECRKMLRYAENLKKPFPSKYAELISQERYLSCKKYDEKLISP